MRKEAAAQLYVNALAAGDHLGALLHRVDDTRPISSSALMWIELPDHRTRSPPTSFDGVLVTEDIPAMYVDATNLALTRGYGLRQPEIVLGY